MINSDPRRRGPGNYVRSNGCLSVIFDDRECGYVNKQVPYSDKYSVALHSLCRLLTT